MRAGQCLKLYVLEREILVGDAYIEKGYVGSIIIEG
jgi:hypothetical protein